MVCIMKSWVKTNNSLFNWSSIALTSKFLQSLLVLMSPVRMILCAWSFILCGLSLRFLPVRFTNFKYSVSPHALVFGGMYNVSIVITTSFYHSLSYVTFKILLCSGNFALLYPIVKQTNVNPDLIVWSGGIYVFSSLNSVCVCKARANQLSPTDSVDNRHFSFPRKRHSTRPAYGALKLLRNGDGVPSPSPQTIWTYRPSTQFLNFDHAQNF